MKTRGKNSKALKIPMIAIIFLMVFPTSVFAEETPSVEVPITVTLEGAPPVETETYNIIFEADNPEYPMPEASEEGSYTLSIEGEGTATLPAISFSSLGIYTYTIYQLEGSNLLGSYDETEYNLVVYVTNALDGSGLETTVLLYRVGETAKLEEIVFVNEYEQPGPVAPRIGPNPPIPRIGPNPPIPRTGDDTQVWPYIGLFIVGLGFIVLVKLTNDSRKVEE